MKLTDRLFYKKVREQFIKVWGNECKEVQKNCPCCGAWDVFRQTFRELKNAKTKNNQED